MKKVLLHNLSIGYVNPVIGCYDFDQLGVFFAESDDILVTRKKIPNEYLDFLKSCGFSINNLNYVYLDQELKNTKNSVFSSSELLDKIKGLINPDEGFILDTFMKTDDEYHYAKKLGIISEGERHQYEFFDNKSYFRSLLKKNKISLPKGYESQSDSVDTMMRVIFLFLIGFNEIIIKHDEGVAGIGSKKISKKVFLLNPGIVESFKKHFNKNTTLNVISQNYVIEGWYENVVSSPSVQFYIESSGEVVHVSTHQQLFYDDKIKYRGCLSDVWIKSDVKEELLKKGFLLASECSKEGYRGHIGFNTILLSNGRLLWVELNARRVMSSYPFQIRERLFGGNASDYCYIYQQVEKQSWVGKSVGDILEILKPVLFSKATMEGVLPVDYRLLKMTGKISIVGFSQKKEDVEKLFLYVNSL